MLILYIVGFVFGMLALFVTQATVAEGYIIGSAVFAAALYALWRMERPPFWTGER